MVDGCRYGLPAAVVRELFRAVTVTALPPGPEVFEGVIDVRGSVVPVFNLRARLKMPVKPIGASDHLIVVEANGRPMALPVDRALDLVAIDAGDIERISDDISGRGRPVEVVKRPDGLVILLDLGMLVQPAELASIEETIAQLEPPAEEDRPS